MSLYLLRVTLADGSSDRRAVPASTPAIIVDLALSAHLARKYPCARMDKTDHKHIARYGEAPQTTAFEKARVHRLDGGRLVALDYNHPRYTQPFAPGLAPDAWPLDETGWPTPALTEVAATVVGSRILVGLPLGHDIDRRWFEATVIGTPEALLLADGSALSTATPAALLAGAMPQQPFELSANGMAWMRDSKGKPLPAGKVCEAVAEIRDFDLSGSDLGSMLIKRDGAWVPLGALA